MLPFKKVLRPTDLSEPACEAVSASGGLASAFSAGLVLVHVVEPVSALPAASLVGAHESSPSPPTSKRWSPAQRRGCTRPPLKDYPGS